MNIGGVPTSASSKINPSEIEGQNGNVDLDTPDLDRKEDAFNHAMGFKPEGQDSSGPEIVVVDELPCEPRLYAGLGESPIGSAAPSPFSGTGNYPSLVNAGPGPALEGMDSVSGSAYDGNIGEQCANGPIGQGLNEQQKQDVANMINESLQGDWNPNDVMAKCAYMVIDGMNNLSPDQKALYKSAVDEIKNALDFTQVVQDMGEDIGDAMEHGGIAIAGAAKDIWDGVKDVWDSI